METARLFVTTLAEINAGSTGGEWLDIEDYFDSEAFLDACAALFPDEQEPIFQFTDSENIPADLVRVSMAEKYLDAIFEWFEEQKEENEITEKTDSWGDSEWVAAHNTYCDNQKDGDSYIYSNDESFFDEHFNGRVWDAVRAVSYGEYKVSDNYVTFDGGANLQSFNDPSDEISKEEILADIKENPRNYNL